MNLKKLLKETKNIAIVGASSNPERDSFKVMKFLMDYGYEIFPVNPKEKNILGRRCYANLKEIEERIDMVDIFRANKALVGVTKEAIKIGAKVLWMQEGIIHYDAANLAKNAGLKVIMDRCPKKELSKPYWTNKTK